MLQPAFGHCWGLSNQRSCSGVIDLLSVMWLWMMEEKRIGFELMEPLGKMLTMRCACMPVRLGVNASHVGGDGWASTNACSPHPWWKTLRSWEGAYWSYAPKRIMLLLKWTGLMYLRQRQAASAAGQHKPTDSLGCALWPLKDLSGMQLPKVWSISLQSHVPTQWE